MTQKTTIKGNCHTTFLQYYIAIFLVVILKRKVKMPKVNSVSVWIKPYKELYIDMEKVYCSICSKIVSKENVLNVVANIFFH